MMFPWRQDVSAEAVGEPFVDNTRTKLSAGAPIFVPSFMQVGHLQNAGKRLLHKLSWTSSRQSSSASTACDTAAESLDTFSSSMSESEDDNDVKLSGGDSEQVNQEPEEVRCPLQVSSKSWAAGQRWRRNCSDQGAEGLGHEDITRRIKSILNKLTIEKFPTLYKQLLSCGIQNNVHLKVLIHEILEKATMQHHFINMYADLCSALQAHFAQQAACKECTMNFKKLLLDAVQASFEQRCAAPVSLKRLEGEELRAAEQKYKMQMLGNIRIVGALLVRKMLAAPVMLAIIDEMLSDGSPEALESLAAFLTVIGPTFDRPEFAQHFILTAIFDQLEARTHDPQIKKRVRCLLKDVLDLRASGWLDQKPKKLDRPATLEEVAQKFQAEAEASSPKKHHAKFVRQVSFESSVAGPKSPEATACRVSPTSRGSLTVKPASDLQQSPANLEPDQGLTNSSQDLSPEELANEVALFIEANGLDEEAVDDLQACPPEVQRMVLSRGDVTSGRNPSAMLRVRINQSMRKLKLNSKALERARATRSASKAVHESSSKPVSPKSSQQTKQGKQQLTEEPAEEQFCKELCRKELAATYAELMNSHDVQDAVTRVAAIAVPTSAQSQELVDLLLFIVDKSSGLLRTVGFTFVVAIFTGNCWVPPALTEGLQRLAKRCDDLKLDVPMLPTILLELVTAFEPLVSSGLLSREELQNLSSAV